MSWNVSFIFITSINRGKKCLNDPMDLQFSAFDYIRQVLPRKKWYVIRSVCLSVCQQSVCGILCVDLFLSRLINLGKNWYTHKLRSLNKKNKFLSWSVNRECHYKKMTDGYVRQIPLVIYHFKALKKLCLDWSLTVFNIGSVKKSRIVKLKYWRGYNSWSTQRINPKFRF